LKNFKLFKIFSLFQTQSSLGVISKVISPLYEIAFSFIKKLSSGRYEVPPQAFPGNSHFLGQYVSEK